MPPLRSSRRHYGFGLYVRPYVPFLWSRYLKNRLLDSYQTLIMYVTCRANEFIRFWGHEVKGHRGHYVCKNSLWSRYLKNRLLDSYQTLVMYVTCRVNVLIRFWGHEVTGVMYAKIACDHTTCMYLLFGVMRSKIKGSYMYMRNSL